MSSVKENKGDHMEDIQHHIKVYINVFIALAILTVVTVAVSFLDVSFIEAFFIAITVATIKGSLVLSYFMHLLEEKPAVIWILVTTMVTFLILMFIPLISSQTKQIHGKRMSLKITHSVIIVLSILLTAYFSYAMSNSSIEYAIIFSFLSAILSVLLVYYLFSIIKKFRVL